MPALTASTLRFDSHQVHRDATLVGDSPLEFITPEPQWSYSVWMPVAADAPVHEIGATLKVTARIEVRHGCIGVGWTRAGGDEFLAEKYVEGPGARTVTLRVPVDAAPGRLMFRNASPLGASRAVVQAVAAAYEHARPYPVTVEHRSIAPEAESDGAQGVFEDDLARSINRARLDFLATLGLPLAGRRVLDAGCGVGHHTPFYTRGGAEVVGLDGRADNIAAMRRLYPAVTGIVGDVQETDLLQLGPFDVVHCFGLLYHLDSPVAALRRLAQVCRGVLIIETMVCDAVAPVMMLADESGSANQALAGLGCRPSPAFVALALDRLGFEHVYGTTAPPQHPDFLFEWRNSMDVSRDGHNLRCVFVASRTPIACDHLVELISRDE